MQPPDDDGDDRPDDSPEIEPAATTEPEASEDLETAYRRALEALESAETEVGLAFEQLSSEDGEEAEPTEQTAQPESPRTLPIAPSPAMHDDRPSPLGILEAALFVGGTSLTSKKLSRLLNDEFDADTLAGFVETLNDRYAEQQRPYEIVFGEGGYRMQLRVEFDDVLHRVFGLGPREIKLSQPALEALALVAYRQPIEHDRVLEHAGKSGLANVRQLVRRQLVELERDDAGVVRYRTTPRFLEVFALSNLDELPRAVELELK